MSRCRCIVAESLSSLVGNMTDLFVFCLSVARSFSFPHCIVTLSPTHSLTFLPSPPLSLHSSIPASHDIASHLTFVPKVIPAPTATSLPSLPGPCPGQLADRCKRYGFFATKIENHFLDERQCTYSLWLSRHASKADPATLL